jgi:DNA-directed RNA polymerase specialized sigma24 family protein
MDRQRRTPDLHEAMSEALAGARSLRLNGWVAEECEAAALERLARYWPDGSRLREPSMHPPYATSAYLLGRRAAIDELRRLTRWRRSVQMREVPFSTTEDGEQHDPPCIEPGFEVVETADDLARSVVRLRPREQFIAFALAAGYTGREVATALRVSPSIISVALRRIRQRLSWI